MALVSVQLNKAKAFLDEVLKRVPEGEREAVRSLYSGAHDELSAVAQDIDTAVVRVNSTAEKQQAWWKARGVETDANGNPIARPNPNPNPNPVTAAVDLDKVTKDFGTRLDTVKEELAGQGLYLASVIPTIVAQHHAEFGEVLDGEQLVQNAVKAGKELKTFYGEMVAPKRAEAAQKKLDLSIKDAEERGRQAGIKEAAGSQMPFPSSRTPSATTLSGLRAAPDKRDQFSLDAAVATAMEVASKAG